MLGSCRHQESHECVHPLCGTRVYCVTSPVNRRSVAFHSAMGFDEKPSHTTNDGLPYHPDYDGPGGGHIVRQLQHDVIFIQWLGTASAESFAGRSFTNR